jgi:hypothetical protein
MTAPTVFAPGYRSTLLPCVTARSIVAEKKYREEMLTILEPVQVYVKNQKFIFKGMPEGTRVFAWFQRVNDLFRVAQHNITFDGVHLDFADEGAYEDLIAQYRVQVLGLPTNLTINSMKEILVSLVPELENMVNWEHGGLCRKIKHSIVKMLTLKQVSSVPMILAKRFLMDEQHTISFVKQDWGVRNVEAVSVMYRSQTKFEPSVESCSVLKSLLAGLVSVRSLFAEGMYVLHCLFVDADAAVAATDKFAIGKTKYTYVSMHLSDRIMKSRTTRYLFPEMDFMKFLTPHQTSRLPSAVVQPSLKALEDKDRGRKRDRDSDSDREPYRIESPGVASGRGTSGSKRSKH